MNVSHRWEFYAVIHFIMVMIHMGLSLVFVLAPGQRFSSASWEPLLNMSGGSIAPWGVMLGMGGILMAFGKTWSDIVGGFIALGWCWWMAALFLVALKDPAASVTGVVVYSGLAAINAALIAQRVIDWTTLRTRQRR